MKEDNRLSRLLSINELKRLYLDIGSAYRTEIDIKNVGYDYIALQNTLVLLGEIGFIHNQDGIFCKVREVDDKGSEGELSKALEDKLSVYIDEMFACDKHFDNETNSFFLYRNEVKSCFLGLLMILGDLDVVIIRGNKVYFSDSNPLSDRVLRKKLSKKQLDRILEHEEELGEAAEQFVLEYEKKKLSEQGINKQPIQISSVDVSAGFDILSYFSNSEDDRKYIEVKSCGKDFEFYISDNEVNTAYMYGERYYLYLYNRVSKTIEEIKNPYDSVFSGNGEWCMYPMLYRMKRSRNMKAENINRDIEHKS